MCIYALRTRPWGSVWCDWRWNNHRNRHKLSLGLSSKSSNVTSRTTKKLWSMPGTVFTMPGMHSLGIVHYTQQCHNHWGWGPQFTRLFLDHATVVSQTTNSVQVHPASLGQGMVINISNTPLPPDFVRVLSKDLLFVPFSFANAFETKVDLFRFYSTLHLKACYHNRPALGASCTASPDSIATQAQMQKPYSHSEANQNSLPLQTTHAWIHLSKSRLFTFHSYFHSLQNLLDIFLWHTS